MMGGSRAELKRWRGLSGSMRPARVARSVQYFLKAVQADSGMGDIQPGVILAAGARAEGRGRGARLGGIGFGGRERSNQRAIYSNPNYNPLLFYSPFQEQQIHPNTPPPRQLTRPSLVTNRYLPVPDSPRHPHPHFPALSLQLRPLSLPGRRSFQENYYFPPLSRGFGLLRNSPLPSFTNYPAYYTYR